MNAKYEGVISDDGRPKRSPDGFIYTPSRTNNGLGNHESAAQYEARMDAVATYINSEVARGQVVVLQEASDYLLDLLAERGIRAEHRGESTLWASQLDNYPDDADRSMCSARTAIVGSPEILLGRNDTVDRDLKAAFKTVFNQAHQAAKDAGLTEADMHRYARQNFLKGLQIAHTDRGELIIGLHVAFNMRDDFKLAVEHGGLLQKMQAAIAEVSPADKARQLIFAGDLNCTIDGISLPEPTAVFNGKLHRFDTVFGLTTGGDIMPLGSEITSLGIEDWVTTYTHLPAKVGGLNVSTLYKHLYDAGRGDMVPLLVEKLSEIWPQAEAVRRAGVVELSPNNYLVTDAGGSRQLLISNPGYQPIVNGTVLTASQVDKLQTATSNPVGTTAGRHRDGEKRFTMCEVSGASQFAFTRWGIQVGVGYDVMSGYRALTAFPVSQDQASSVLAFARYPKSRKSFVVAGRVADEVMEPVNRLFNYLKTGFMMAASSAADCVSVILADNGQRKSLKNSSGFVIYVLNTPKAQKLFLQEPGQKPLELKRENCPKLFDAVFAAKSAGKDSMLLQQSALIDATSQKGHKTMIKHHHALMTLLAHILEPDLRKVTVASDKAFLIQLEEGAPEINIGAFISIIGAHPTNQYKSKQQTAKVAEKQAALDELCGLLMPGFMTQSLTNPSTKKQLSALVPVIEAMTTEDSFYKPYLTELTGKLVASLAGVDVAVDSNDEIVAIDSTEFTSTVSATSLDIGFADRAVVGAYAGMNAASAESVEDVKAVADAAAEKDGVQRIKRALKDMEKRGVQLGDAGGLFLRPDTSSVPVAAPALPPMPSLATPFRQAELPGIPESVGRECSADSDATDYEPMLDNEGDGTKSPTA